MECGRTQPQIKVESFGEEGQRALQNAKVIVVGAGGLGCAVLQSLVGIGVGHIAIADDDRVSVSNLGRQFLYTPSDVEKYKTEVAKEKLQVQNPDVAIATLGRITEENADSILAQYQVVVDASDNFATRYLINDCCVRKAIPFVVGAVENKQGYVTTCNWKGSPHFRDLFPTGFCNHNCSTQGVLGPIPSIIGHLQAMEVLKIITECAPPLASQLLFYNGCSFTTYTYEKNHFNIVEISKLELQLLPNPQLIDAQSPPQQIDMDRPIVFYCKYGFRSMQMAIEWQSKCSGQIYVLRAR